MARKALVDSIIKLYSKLGGNVSDVLGTRTNINFLGVGKSPEGFIDSTINIDAIGALGKNKVLEELKSSIGYLTANKLNDIQAGKLYENMLKIDDVFNPKQIPNITDLGTGTRDLTQEGLGALRATRKTDDDVRVINDELDLPPLRDVIDARNEKSLNLPPLMSRVESQMEKIKGTSSKLDDAMKEYENIYKSADDLPPPGSRGGPDDIAAPVEQFSTEVDALETMVKNRAGNDFIAGYVTELYKNAGAVSATEVAKKRAAARAFLNTMLKKETDLLPQGGTLESVISPTDYKYITEGGGGVLGDPLVLIKKYFGDTITQRLPLSSDRIIIEEFVDNVRFAKDRSGFATDDPRFNPDDIPEFKHGGLAQILEV
tara:strand:- start:186 stop:1304 length:1119 start_codon:yes stop_codon:yes gene_type:complete